ncbi:3-hydroxyacyl-CoA dehydratase 2, partial [Eufriesea mexicana]
MKSKKSSNVGTLYLKTYNLLQVFGWSYILYKFLNTDLPIMLEGNVWENIKWLVIIFQHAAVLEVVHILIGLVKSNPILTTIQIASRVIVVTGILSAIPYDYVLLSLGVPLLITAWSITEIIRYLYYFMHLNDFVPYFLTWLRYTLFIILYPLGVTGELLCIYAAVKYASSYPEAWSYNLPNSWNFIFSYYFILVCLMISYVPLFPQMYLHMFSQRRKILGSHTSKK